MIISAIFGIIVTLGVGGSIVASAVAPSLRSWERTAAMISYRDVPDRPYLWDC